MNVRVRTAWLLVVATLLPALAFAAPPDAAPRPPGRSDAADKKAACYTSYEQGQIARRDGHLRAAAESFEACGAPACPAATRGDCQAWSADLVLRMPRIRAHAFREKAAGLRERIPAADVRLAIDSAPVDGSEAHVVDGGRHRIELRIAGAAPVVQEVVVAEGDTRDVDLVVPSERAASPAAASSSGRVVSYVLGGAGLAALGTAGILIAAAVSDRSNMQSTCYPHCPEDRVSAVRRNLLIGDVLSAVGLVAVGTSAALLLFGAPKRPGTAARADVMRLEF